MDVIAPTFGEALDRAIRAYLTEWITGDMSGTFEGIETDGSD